MTARFDQPAWRLAPPALRKRMRLMKFAALDPIFPCLAIGVLNSFSHQKTPATGGRGGSSFDCCALQPGWLPSATPMATHDSAMAWRPAATTDRRDVGAQLAREQN